MGASVELQKAVFNALTGAYPVYDDVSTPIQMPYILLGDETVNRNDPKGEQLSEHVLTIHAYSNYSGSKQVKEMNDYIITKLVNQQITVTGFTVCRNGLELAEVSKELDANRVTLSDNVIIYHGIVQVRFHLYKDS
ncbi:tail completion protein gp17 [Gottfriedia acidiceleris]|uniref:tail completion protein gp17 n=1 Tax=Gottfriedia acidiceleris TaxID=371036 RepID=UPI00101CA283|nr:DUF3168 domain-containing protein [Gottfriedia acidiceleris]